MTTTNETYAKGSAMRRAILGDEYVDRSARDPEEFGAAMQDLVIQYCWGEIWTRDALSPKLRSLVNLGMLTALNRPAELALHIRGALRNGCTEVEVEEVLLQSAVYCGIPAALESFRVAREVLADERAG